MLWRAALSALLTLAALVVIWRRRPERERALGWARRLERGDLRRVRGAVKLGDESVTVWSSGERVAYAEIMIVEAEEWLDDDVERISFTSGIHGREVAAVGAFEVVSDEGPLRVPLGEGSLVYPAVRAVAPSGRTAAKMPAIVGSEANPVYHEGVLGPGARVVVYGQLGADDEGSFRASPGERGFTGPVLVVEESIEAAMLRGMRAVPRSRVTVVRVVASVVVGAFGGLIALLLAAAASSGW